MEAKPDDSDPKSGTRTPAINLPLDPPRKRSVTIAGHETSIALEPIFWSALENAASERQLPLNALIARIDAQRLGRSPPVNLASAIRQWLYAKALARQ